MKWNKKGAIELSITTIVVLIIALAVLGVAILIINMIRDEATGVLKDQLASLRAQALDCIGQSGNIFCFKLLSKEIEIGKKIAVGVGLKNTAASQSTSGGVCFRTQYKCIRPHDPEGFCDRENQRNDITVGGMDYDGSLPSTYWFSKSLTQAQTELKENEAKSLDAVLEINDAKAGGYEMIVNVYKANNDRACNDGPDFSSETYASEGFTITVN